MHVCWENILVRGLYPEVRRLSLYKNVNPAMGFD